MAPRLVEGLRAVPVKQAGKAQTGIEPNFRKHQGSRVGFGTRQYPDGQIECCIGLAEKWEA